MTGSISVFGIPLLLDIVCNSLDPEDIWNCASCCKEWHSYFGPYRFQSVSLTHSNNDRISFFSNNNRHFHKLRFSFATLESLDVSHCARLRELEIVLTNEDAEVSSVASNSNTISETRTRAADLIQRNQYLRTLQVRATEGCSGDLASLAQPILDAIKNHSFLTTLTVNVALECQLIPKFMAHLPPQLLELDMRKELVRCFCRASDEDHPREFHVPKLSLRRLMLTSPLSCVDSRMFPQLLRQCPDLEVLQWPVLSYGDRPECDSVELAQVIETHYGRFHTLMVLHYDTRHLSSIYLYGFVQAYSKGLRCLQIFVGDRPQGYGDNLLFLTWCPRLQELVIERHDSLYDGLHLEVLVGAMDKPWECWHQLEVLKVDVDTDRELEMDLDNAYTLFLHLRSLPKLKTLDLRWNELNELGHLTLANLNGVARKQDSVPMTEEDYIWMGMDH
ncbi:hypothetical protein B0O80DRAFT_498828 [Mortierella sp. GBAus27b]|nr:hypothetical protein B0O80DRAFT_498828 [Mortierella sp. GBAus27b]